MTQRKETEQQKNADAKRIIFRYLKYRPRSEEEITLKLRDKEFSEDITQQTTEYFKKIGAINDRSFAAGWIRSRLNKPYGKYRIHHELKRMGVNENIITDAMRECSEDYDEHAAILNLAKRRMRKYEHLDRHTARRRLYEYLGRRGFNTGAIIKVLNEISKHENRNSK